MKSNSHIQFICNDELIKTSLHPATTVLDFVRKHLHLSGTKEACREGDCGACTILVGEICEGELKYHSVNSCLLPIGKINGKHIVTIEGLNQTELNPIQNAIVDEGGTQCGFCTPGFILSMTGYFLNGNKFNIQDLLSSLEGNICRCTGYTSIRRAAHDTLNLINNGNRKHDLKYLRNKKIVPDYFLQIPERLKKPEDIKIIKDIKKVNNKVVISGGTDLFVQQWDEIIDSGVSFIDKPRQSKLIYTKNNRCFIHAGATISDIKNSSVIKNYFPQVDKYFNLFGSLQIRNTATIGGNIVNASPIGDSTIFFLAHNAKLHIQNRKSSREVLLKNFYKGYKSLDLKKGETLEYLSFPLPKDCFFFNFEKVSRRTILDIASVNSAVYISMNKNKINEIHISAGGVYPFPKLLEKTSASLKGKEINNENILTAASVAQSEILPISDVRGSAEYKSLLLRQLIFSHFLELFPEQIQVEELV